VLADVPGLIEGAHAGSGLGTRFLGHVERCSVLLHLVDATAEDVAAAYRTVRTELKAYGAGLERKKEIVALSKCDALDATTLAGKVEALRRTARKKPLVLSAVARHGLKEVLATLAREIAKAKTPTRLAQEHRPWQP
jgi:GTP-binding protein